MNDVGRSRAAKPRILSFCRPYLVADFRANLAAVADEFELDFLTDGRAPGTRDTRTRFYENLRNERRCAELDEATEAEVRARCRLLRNVPAARARALMHAMALVLAHELDSFRPGAVLCHMVDEYVTHLLAILATRRGARFVGYAHSYFPGLLQLTQYAHGGAFDVREPADDEVERILDTIGQRIYRQNYMQRSSYTLARHLYGLARYRLKLAVFRTKSILERDPWNLHYAITPFVVERRRLRDFPRGSDFAADWSKALRELVARSGRPVVYLPLAYFPESTLDYWVRDTRILRYEDLSIEMIRTLARDHVVVVKEHLHMMGCRDSSFYPRLRAEAQVVSVHPHEYSNDVLAASDAVVLGAGSVGVEATIRDKPVLSYCDSSYWFAASGATALALDDLTSWPAHVGHVLRTHAPLSAAAKHRFIGQCLRSTARPRPGGRRWPFMDIEDLRSVLRLAVRQEVQ